MDRIAVKNRPCMSISRGRRGRRDVGRVGLRDRRGFEGMDALVRSGVGSTDADERRPGVCELGLLNASVLPVLGCSWLLSVRDDGDGFEPTASTAGFGLLGRRERVGLLHGTVQTASSPGDGTTVTASFPARRRPATAATATPDPIRATGAS
jgi:signal transduction histidine kinase